MASPEKPCLLLIVIRAGGHEAVGKAATEGRSLSITVNRASLGPEKVRRCAWGRRVKRSWLCGCVRRLSGRECTALAEDCSCFPAPTVTTNNHLLLLQGDPILLAFEGACTHMYRLPPPTPAHPTHVDIIWKYISLNLKCLGSPLKKIDEMNSWETRDLYLKQKTSPEIEEVVLHIATLWSPKSIHAHAMFRLQTRILGDLGVYKDRLGSLQLTDAANGRALNSFRLLDWMAMAWKIKQLFWNKHLYTLSRSTLSLDVLN